MTNGHVPADAGMRRRGRRALRPDRGTGFAEILVSIVLLGTVIVALIAGLRTTISVSSGSEDQAKVEAILTSAADRLTAADYIPCPGNDFGDYEHLVGAAAAAVNPTNDPDQQRWTADLVNIENILFWDSTAGGTTNADGDPIDADGAWSTTNSLNGSGECNADINLTTSRTLQLVTISVTSPDGDIVRTIQVVKSPIVADPEA